LPTTTASQSNRQKKESGEKGDAGLSCITDIEVTEIQFKFVAISDLNNDEFLYLPHSRSPLLPFFLLLALILRLNLSDWIGAI